MSTEREETVARVASELVSRRDRQAHPLRVGIDGRSTAGKTHLAHELVAELETRHVTALRVGIDEFHRKGHKGRSERGDWTPESRLAEGLDYESFRACVLQPLGPGGSRRIRPRKLDSFHDEYWPEEWLEVAEGAIVVCDAGHGFVPQLRDLWDYRIWLEISAETMVARATSRDIAWAGSREQVRQRYEAFWVPMDAYYQSSCEPAAVAHCVIENNDLGRPVILRI